ncbi:MAG TPA: DUF4249 domain-containing protein [Mucilaginibacter sp.]
MKKHRYIWYCILLCGGIIIACKKPYNPKVVSSPNSYLVVEGMINTNGDPTVIKLSKTVNLGESVKSAIVTGYTVTIQDAGGNTISQLISPSNDGKYSSGTGVNLDATKKYRLHIASNDGVIYESDYMEVKKNPPIDSVGFTTKGNNLNIYVNTHDATNSTRYYRWDFEEAWKFHARYESGFLVDPGTKAIRARRNDEESYYCYTGDASSNIVISSSAKLVSDVIYQAPVTTILSTSERISVRYSILVKQYAITKPAYEFWENIRKNTEQLGSIFDAQPSQLQGNIHCVTNPNTPVIGFVGITNVQQKRIFIDNSELPLEWFSTYPYSCELDSALYYNPKTMSREVEAYIINGFGVPVSPISQMNNVIGYTYSSLECTDCRIRGQSQPPPFWKP